MRNSRFKILKNLKLCFQVVLFVGIIFNLSFYIWCHKESYLTKFDEGLMKEEYENSQWSKGWYATTQMSDAEHHAWAGWNLIHGKDPSLVNKEKPLLGKYFIGLSLLLFRNENVVSIFWGVAVLVVCCLLGWLVLKDKFWSLILVFLVSREPLFKENLATSLLDLPFIFFILLSVWSFLKGLSDKKFFYLSAVFLGLAAGTKVFLVCFYLGVLLGIFLFLIGRKQIILKFWITIMGVYVLTYIQYFAFHDFLDFIYLHYWVFWFSRNIVPNYPFFQIWRLLLTGDWLTWKPHPPDIWFDLEIKHIDQYNLFWTLSGLLFCFEGFLSIKKRLFSETVIFLLVIGYLLFWSFAPPYPRYLLPVLPLIYLLALGRLRNFPVVKLLS